MKDSKFWNECTAYPTNSLRAQVAEFIDDNPELTHLENERYYDFEDALMEFIYENRQLIADEVEREHYRNDFVDGLFQSCNESPEVKEFIDSLPIDFIDDVVDNWQDNLMASDRYWELIWEYFDDAIDELVSNGYNLGDFSETELLCYAAYLQEWYKTHTEGSPVGIEEFLDNEMEDEEIKAHYEAAAKKLLKKENKDA